jgi:ribosomal protein S18 acetylase RimI-like enzyme
VAPQSEIRIVTVDAENVAQERFFCYKSKKKAEGYRLKMAWLEGRFAEGLRIKILYEGKRSVGFVEYIPGEHAWRAVNAEGYLLIHCLWVVGKGKNKGYGSRLINECLDDARAMGKRGVAMVTSSSNWLAGKKILLKNGFESLDQAPPTFELLVKRFGETPTPFFPTNWEERCVRHGAGMTVVYAPQCPYIVDAIRSVQEAAGERNIEVQVVELTAAEQVQELAPSPYGVYNVVYNGELLTYQPYVPGGIVKLLDGRAV